MKQTDIILGQIYFWEYVEAKGLIKIIRYETNPQILIVKFIKNINNCEFLMSGERYVWSDCCRKLTNLEKMKYL